MYRRTTHERRLVGWPPRVQQEQVVLRGSGLPRGWGQRRDTVLSRTAGPAQDALSAPGLGIRVPGFIRSVARSVSRLVPRAMPFLVPGLPPGLVRWVPNLVPPLGRLFPESPLAWTLFKTVVASNIAFASPIAIPQVYKDRLLAYANYNKLDGAALLAGFVRRPRYFRGGWIMKLQGGAGAMTLDTAVFVTGQLPITTYIHEMVHVGQYRILGITGFLSSYFGISGLTILQRWIRRQPTDPMRSSPHEEQAYRIEARFCEWHKKFIGPLSC